MGQTARPPSPKDPEEYTCTHCYRRILRGDEEAHSATCSDGKRFGLFLSANRFRVVSKDGTAVLGVN